MANPPGPIGSVCVFCGSSSGHDPAYAEAARALGRGLAEAGLRLVYGGGGIGLMGETARAAHGAGGQVLGVMPEFLQARERLLDSVETVVVSSMHERKAMMYDAADAFIALPGGVGTLEEVVELLSWKRLDLHAKPMIFIDVQGFWQPLLATFRQGVEAGFTPDWFLDSLIVTPDVAGALSVLDPR